MSCVTGNVHWAFLKEHLGNADVAQMGNEPQGRLHGRLMLQRTNRCILSHGKSNNLLLKKEN